MMYDGYAALSAPRRAAPDLNADNRSGGLLTIIERIEQAIDQETTAIRTDMNFDVADSNIRKSRHLYDLSRALKAHGLGDLPASAANGLKQLREKLAVNQAALAAHLAAVTEVAALMQGAIQHAEADGTYSASAFGGGY